MLSAVTSCRVTLPFLLLILTYPALVTFYYEECDSNYFMKEGLGSAHSFRGFQSLLAERYGWKALPVAVQAYRCCCCCWCWQIDQEAMKIVWAGPGYILQWWPQDLTSSTQGTKYLKHEPKGSVSHLNHTMYSALQLPAVPSLRNHNSTSITIEINFFRWQMSSTMGFLSFLLDLITYHNDL